MPDILMFHRVLPKAMINPSDAYFIRGTLISQERLEHLIVTYLNKEYTFATIDRLTESSNKRQVVLTFDDGYTDNYWYVKPLLEKYAIKATFYPVIGYCKEQKIAPLDYYYHYVNTNIPLGKKNNWIIGEQKKLFLNLSLNNQNIFLQKLFLGDFPVMPLSYMTLAQLQELHSLGHELGGHSYYHAIYPSLNRHEIIQDIQRTKAAFHQIGVVLTSYAYTDGQYDWNTIESLKKEQITIACAIKSNKLTLGTNYELERKFVTEHEIITT